MTPRLQAVFRYTTLPDFLPVGDEVIRTYDRSFDVRYQLLTETARRPAVTVGLQDIGGTSIYAAEYIVASKSFLDGRLTATGGIGWGRLGTRGGFSNPLGALSDRFDTRPDLDFGRGGTVSTDQLFRGDAALFGGLQYRAGERLTLAAEYSSDAYEEEELRRIVDPKTPLNFSATYQVRDGIALAGYVLHGAEVGMTLRFDVNPRRSPTGSGTEGLPPPVTVRPSRTAAPALWTTSWPGDARVEPAVRAALAEALDEQGIDLVATTLGATRAEIRYRNRRWGVEAQALGRVARVASGIVPASVETFVLVPVTEDGVPGAAAILRRSDLEALENRPDGADEIEAVTGYLDAAGLPAEGRVQEEEAFPRFRWSLGPSIDLGYFDPNSPVRYDLGLTLGASWQPRPGLRFEGGLRQSLGGTLDDVTRETFSSLPRVRTDGPEFARADGPVVEYLTGDYLFRAGPALYGRLSAGLLERQFGGVSGEMLFKRGGQPARGRSGTEPRPTARIRRRLRLPGYRGDDRLRLGLPAARQRLHQPARRGPVPRRRPGRDLQPDPRVRQRLAGRGLRHQDRRERGGVRGGQLRQGDPPADSADLGDGRAEPCAWRPDPAGRSSGTGARASACATGSTRRCAT